MIHEKFAVVKPGEARRYEKLARRSGGAIEVTRLLDQKGEIFDPHAKSFAPTPLRSREIGISVKYSKEGETKVNILEDKLVRRKRRNVAGWWAGMKAYRERQKNHDSGGDSW